MIKVSVPGKVHLIGEHAVVFGRPAILSAINLRLALTLEKASRREILGIEKYDDALEKLQNCLEEFIKKKFKKKIPPYKIVVSSSIPLGSGLGSSAALCCAYSAALLKFLKLPGDLEMINEMAYLGEKVFQGNPSGGDNTTVTYGGFIWYRKESEDIKIFAPLPFKISKKIKDFILINSGKPFETTSEMIDLVKAKVKSQKSKMQLKIQKLFDDQELLTKLMLKVLKDGGEEELIDILQKAERNLEELGVVGKNAKYIIRKIEATGGGAKITGGGGIKEGSGMIIAYHKNVQKLVKLAEENSWEIFPINLREKGLRYE